MCKKEYAEWYLFTHPKPVDMRQSTRYWLNKQTQLHRRQHPVPRSYEEFRQNKAGNEKNYEEGSYVYISAPPQDTWDRGSIYRMYMIRKQAAIDMTHKPEAGIFIKEQDIDDWLIANDYADEDDSSITSSQAAVPSRPRKGPSSNPTPTEPSTSTHCIHRARLGLLLPLLTGSA
jgi:hypothetical protein